MEYRKKVAPVHVYSGRQKVCVLEDVHGDVQGARKRSYSCSYSEHGETSQGSLFLKEP